jgi:hypothetical protein
MRKPELFLAFGVNLGLKDVSEFMLFQTYSRREHFVTLINRAFLSGNRHRHLFLAHQKAAFFWPLLTLSKRISVSTNELFEGYEMPF